MISFVIVVVVAAALAEGNCDKISSIVWRWKIPEFIANAIIMGQNLEKNACATARVTIILHRNFFFTHTQPIVEIYVYKIWQMTT